MGKQIYLIVFIDYFMQCQKLASELLIKSKPYEHLTDILHSN